MPRKLCLLVLVLAVLTALPSPAQMASSEQVQIGVPPTRQVGPPSLDASAEDLEKRGDQLRTDKAYLDAIDYYQAALDKKINNPNLYNKIGISELMLQRYKEAGKNFQRAIKADKQFPDAYNNLGVIYYEEKKYGKAISHYEKAIKLKQDSASYFSNLGAAYFSKKQFDKAAEYYGQALQLDPDVFERSSRSGVSAQLPSPEDRAHYSYVMAKLYAKAGALDRSLECLRRALEEGYKGIEEVYKDSEFIELRKDPRFTQLMAFRPTAISE